MGFAVQIDESRWPIVVVRWPRTTSLADVDGYFERRAGWFAREERFALVVDGTQSRGFDTSLRRRVTELSRDQADLARRWLAGEALVLQGLAQRAVLTALEWLLPPVHPRCTFSSMPEALTWAADMVGPAQSSAG